MWEEEIHKQAEHFEAFATQILQVDTEIIANAANIKQLQKEHGQLKSRQDTVDQSILQIWEQQDALGNLLEGLQKALQPALPDEAVGGQPPTKAHQLAQLLTMQLDKLDQQAEDLARETETVQSTLYAEPLTTVVRVLDAHASALEAMQEQVGSVSQRLKTIETSWGL